MAATARNMTICGAAAAAVVVALTVAARSASAPLKDSLPPNPGGIEIAAWDISHPWQLDLRQDEIPADRAAALKAVRGALAGADRTSVLAALQAIAQTSDVAFDRSGLRELIRPSLDAPETSIRLAAWTALVRTGAEPADVERLRVQIAGAPKESRPALVQRMEWLVASDDAGVRAAAAAALASLDRPPR